MKFDGAFWSVKPEEACDARQEMKEQTRCAAAVEAWMPSRFRHERRCLWLRPESELWVQYEGSCPWVSMSVAVSLPGCWVM